MIEIHESASQYGNWQVYSFSLRDDPKERDENFIQIRQQIIAQMMGWA